MKIREFNIAIIFIVASLVVYGFFPVSGIFQQIITTLIFFVVLPLLFNKVILKKELNKSIFGLGNYKQGILWSSISLIALGLIFFIISYYFNFLNQYSVPGFIIDNFVNFVFYEFILVASFVAVYEFYFRGFIMPVFNEKIGQWSIMIQAAVFLFLVFNNGGGNIIPFVPYLLFAPFAGVIVYKSKSLLYSGTTQFIILLILNLITIKKLG